MNIIEAVKSGKRFKRSFMIDWWKSNQDMVGLYRSDIVADDWEVEEEKVEITYEQLREAFVEKSE